MKKLTLLMLSLALLLTGCAVVDSLSGKRKKAREDQFSHQMGGHNPFHTNTMFIPER